MGVLQDSIATLVRTECEKGEAESRQVAAITRIRTTRLNELASLLLEDSGFLREHNLDVRDGNTGELVGRVREIWTGPLIVTTDSQLIADVNFDTAKQAYTVNDWSGCEPGPLDKPLEQKLFSSASTCVGGMAELLVKYTDIGPPK